MLVRLQKYLAESGIASRRKSEQLIVNGKVKVNGNIVTELGTKIDDTEDIVFCNGKKVIKNNRFVYIMLNKPEGCVTTAEDQFDRKTIMDYVKDINIRLYPVGRLDYNTSGLLILTNDGDLAYKLTHPKHNVKKIYMAKIYGLPTSEEIKKFEKGIYIDNNKTSPSKIEIIKNDGKYTNVKIEISEGRNRQIRKMCEEINHPVKKLKRIATGQLSLGDLKIAQYRHLTKDEVYYLKNI